MKRILLLILAALMTMGFCSVAHAASAAPSLNAPHSFSAALKGTKLYEANDSESKVLAVVPAGTIFAIRETGDGWTYVEDIGKQTVGYVKTSGLTVLQPPDEWMQTNAVYINRETSLYPQPKASGKIVLYPGTRIEILGTIKNYYAIQVGTGKKSLFGYVKKQDGLLIGGGVLKTYRKKQVVDTQGDIPVIAGPDAKKYPPIGSLKPDERVSFDKEWGEYSQIIFEDAEGYRVTGYVESKYLFYPFVGKTPVDSTLSPDGKMRMDLYISDGPYRAGEEIFCYAMLCYLGKSSRQVFYASGCLMAFGITGGKLSGGGVITDDAAGYVIERKQPIRMDFAKGHAWSADDPDAAFFEAYNREPKLLLPRGEYTITASLGYTYTLFTKSESFNLSTSTKIKVE